MQSHRPMPKKEHRAEGCSVFVLGHLGETGLSRLLQEKREVFCRLFSEEYRERIQAVAAPLTKEEREAAQAAADFWYEVGEESILEALWHFSQEHRVGLYAGLRQLPLRQETIEVCERLGVNPYELSSEGCYLAAVRDGEGFMACCRGKGLQLTHIGRFTPEETRVLENRDGLRYLERPREDNRGERGVIC